MSDLKREVDTMVLLDELRVTMSDYQKDMDELYEVLGVAAATERYNVLQEEIAKEGFWDDLEHSRHWKTASIPIRKCNRNWKILLH